MNIDSKQSKYSDPAFVFKATYTNEHHSFPAFQKAKEEFGSTIGMEAHYFPLILQDFMEVHLKTFTPSCEMG